MKQRRFFLSVLAALCIFFSLFLTLFVPHLDASAQDAIRVNQTGVLSATGYDYVLDNSKLTYNNMTLLTTNTNWVKTRESIPNSSAHVAILWNQTLNAGSYDLPDVKLRFSDCVEAYDNGSYDLILTFSNIHIQSSRTMQRPDLLYSDSSERLWIAAGDMTNTGGVAHRQYVTYQIVKHGTNTPVSGSMLLGFTDLDVYNINREFAGRPWTDYREGFTIISGGTGNAWVESDTYLSIMDNGTTFTSTRSTSGTAEELRAGVSFLGNASGTTIAWGGFSCGTMVTLDMDAIWPQYKVTPSKEGPGTITPSTVRTVNQGMSSQFTMTADANAHIESVTVDGKAVTVTNNKNMTYSFTNIRANHTIHVKFVRDSYAVKTQVRWQNVDGSWTNYQTVDSKTVTHGTAYSYTWVRNAIKNEPTNIYNNGSPKTVGTSSVTGPATYSIDVSRKQYTYTFNFNPPSGHSVSEIRNRQANLTNKYAETMSGTVKNPSLTGYTFLGWNTKADGSGTAYANEKMLSNKTFYAVWKTNTYTVKYNGNGSQNPDQQTGEFTQNNVTSQSGMPDSTYQCDQTGTLRKNDFVRAGYTFIGWNTKADGSGTSYADQYNKVLNWTSSDGGVITLYAQWKKNLGTETITVVSEETGNPVSGVAMKLYKKVNGSWEEVPGVGTLATNSKGQITANNLHWFDYEWRSIQVPAGYEAMVNTDFRIHYNQLSAQNQVTLYLKHVTITIRSQVSDLIQGENPPAFLYFVTGTDAAGVDHSYSVLVETDRSRNGSYVLKDLFAGQYQIVQTPVQRYLPGTAKNISNMTISGSSVSTDLRSQTSAEVLFPYTIQQYGGFAHTDNEVNHLVE